MVERKIEIDPTLLFGNKQQTRNNKEAVLTEKQSTTNGK